jgi:hypothetical protein
MKGTTTSLGQLMVPAIVFPASSHQGPPNIASASHVTGCHLVQDARVQNTCG